MEFSFSSIYAHTFEVGSSVWVCPPESEVLVYPHMEEEEKQAVMTAVRAEF
jgi:hypothetical protein